MSGRDGGGRGGMDAKAGSAAEAEEASAARSDGFAGESLGALVPAALVPAALVPAAASPGRPAKLLRITRSPLRDDRRMGSSADAGVHATCSSAETRTPPEPPPPSPSVAVPRLLRPPPSYDQASAGSVSGRDDFATSRAISGRHIVFVLASTAFAFAFAPPPRARHSLEVLRLPPSRSVPAARPRDRDSCALRDSTCAWSSSSCACCFASTFAVFTSSSSSFRGVVRPSAPPGRAPSSGSARASAGTAERRTALLPTPPCSPYTPVHASSYPAVRRVAWNERVSRVGSTVTRGGAEGASKYADAETLGAKPPWEARADSAPESVARRMDDDNERYAEGRLGSEAAPRPLDAGGGLGYGAGGGRSLGDGGSRANPSI